MSYSPLFEKFVAFTTSLSQMTEDLTSDLQLDDITPVQFSILRYLAVSQPVTPSQISLCQHISMPNTSRELRKLTDKQLCVKQVDKIDRRKQLLYLSDQGQQLMDQVFAHMERKLLGSLHTATAPELEQVEQALETLMQVVIRPYINE